MTNSNRIFQFYSGPDDKVAVSKPSLQKSDEKKYVDMMEKAKVHMLQSLTYLKTSYLAKLLKKDGDKALRFNNLCLTSDSKHYNPAYPGFDALWTEVRELFDIARNYPDDEQKYIEIYKPKFKKIIHILIQAGIPFVDNRQLNFWSGDFAKHAAEIHAKSTGGVTDGMAQQVLRKIFMGWDPSTEISLNIFYHLTHSDKSPYPEVARFFWQAFSETYSEEAKAKDTVHAFFQDSITVGNYFWENELKKVREVGATVMLHKYDLQKNQWQELNFDSKEAKNIFLRRRVIHPMDVPHDVDVDILGGKKVWKQVFNTPEKGSKEPKKCLFWASPKILTVGKLKEITKKWKKYKSK